VIQAFESKILNLPDFYFTGDDYRYRFEPDAKERFLDLLRERFSAGVRYNGRVLKWDTVIERKAIELGRFLIGRSPKLDFTEPSPTLSREDDREMRRRILNLSQSEAEQLGIGKSTLHNLRVNARRRGSFKLYRKTVGSLNTTTVLARSEQAVPGELRSSHARS
jgi:CRISPR-associated protein Cas1